MKAFTMFLLFSVAFATKRSASSIQKGPALKKATVKLIQQDLVLALPTEIFDLVLLHCLKSLDKSLAALASTCWDYYESTTNWCFRHVHERSLLISDPEADVLAPLVLPLIEEFYLDDDGIDEDASKIVLLSDIFLGLGTHHNAAKLISLLEVLEPTNHLKEAILKRIIHISHIPPPFQSNEPILETAWEMICYGLYRVGLPYLLISGPKAFPVLSAIFDIFIYDHSNKNHKPETGIRFTKTVMEFMPEMWQRKVQLLSDIFPVFGLPGTEIELYPIVRAIKEMSSGNTVLQCSERADVGKRILNVADENGELLFYSMLQSAINCHHIADPENYPVQTTGLTSNILPNLMEISDNCKCVFAGLTIVELASWNWQMRDLVRAILAYRSSDLKMSALFKGYLKASCYSTVLFTYQCFEVGSNQFENLLIGSLESIQKKQKKLWETLKPQHIRHICNVLNVLEPEPKEIIETLILSILTSEYSALVEVMDPTTCSFFNEALMDNEELQDLSITAIKATPALNTWIVRWALIEMFPRLEGKLRDLMQES